MHRKPACVHNGIKKTETFYPFGAETEICRGIQANLIAADALAICFAKSSAEKWLTGRGRRISVYYVEG